jgi:uncharacterized protein
MSLVPTPDEINQLVAHLPTIHKFAQQHHAADDVHGWGHVLRVLENARIIHEHEGGSWPLIEAMVLLHDIGRESESVKKKSHALLSAEITGDYLRSLDLPLSLIETIQQGILGHSFTLGQRAQDLEGKILSDADKLDALGAIGIFRTCAFQANSHTGLSGVLAHLDEKLLGLQQLCFLDTSKRIAEERTSRLRRFKADLLEELGKN